MIILDTNILWGTKLRGSSAELLRAIRASHVERVAVPWLVMEKLAAKRALAYEEKYEAADKALRDLKQAKPWGNVQGPGRRDLERAREYWREEYGRLVEVIPPKDAHFREGAYREANRIDPCRTVRSHGKDHKVGARDAAIWLSAIDYAVEHEDELVFFVSGNTKDFGDGTSLPPAMVGDIAGVADRFEILTSLDGLIERFTKPAEADLSQVEEAARAPESLAAVVELAASGASTNFLCTEAPHHGIRSASSPVATRWLGPPSVALESVEDVSAHRIGDHLWCTATVRWLLHGFGTLFDSPKPSVIGAAWTTRVLLSLSGAEPRLTLLHHEEPTALRRGDAASLPSLWAQGADAEAAEPGMAETELLLGFLKDDAGARSLRELQLYHWIENWHPRYRYGGRIKPPPEE
ncbi:hypothetical protein EES45_07235 [Streptomyces sp. ADI97-07]|nr:hypothetical protein EES45_07235 [Streptomyces sp. ADI97-07]